MADAQSTTPSSENAFDPQVLLGKFKTFVKDTPWVHAAEIQKATKQEAWMVVGAALGILVPVILMMWGTAIVTDIIGFGYPAYMTIQTLALKDGEAKSAATKTWLCFWLIAGMFNTFLDTLLFFIPYYDYAKAATFGAMMAPSLNAPTKIYDLLSLHVLSKIPGLLPAKSD